jgi:hypothetical protein
MSTEIANALEGCSATVTRGATHTESVASPEGMYFAECYDAEGNLKWTDYIKNVVTNAGRNSMLDINFRAQTQITTWYIGLISSVSYSAVANTDTMTSHTGWTEACSNNAPNYNQTSRRAVTWAAAASKAIASSNACVFSITGSGTVKGAFLVSSALKNNTSTAGTLYSAGLFTAGDKVVSSGDTLNVSYTTVLGG